MGLWSGVVILLSIFAYEGSKFILPYAPEPRSKKIVLLEKQRNLRAIAKALHEEGILATEIRFVLLAKILGKERQLRLGEYEMYAPSSPYEVLKVLTKGKPVLHAVTIPEGLRIAEIVPIMEASKLVKREALVSLLGDVNYQRELNVPGPSFEGFLFPETYRFSMLDGEKKILETMVERFFEEITPERKERASQLGFGLLEWITLASIIEKESGLASEHPIISSVFHNRLQKKMRLQSDPTVIYGMANYDGRIRYKDLRTPTAYNTYTIPGLPPGPIANPGSSAIHAALYPAKTDFFYFVAKKDGSHVFAKTNAEHARNVNYYIRGIKTAKPPSPR